MDEVFISHKVDDPDVPQDFLDGLAGHIRGAGCVPWMDQQSLTGGDSWRPEIDDAIARSVGMIAVVTPAAGASGYVIYEWSTALAWRKPVIPLLLADTKLHARLERINYIDFRDGKRPWHELEKALRKWVVTRQAMQLTVPLPYQLNALEQLLASFRREGHDQVHLSTFSQQLGNIVLRDGINPMYEPLTLQKVEAGVQELIEKGKLAIDRDFLILK
jgi:hypothetical protein